MGNPTNFETILSLPSLAGSRWIGESGLRSPLILTLSPESSPAILNLNYTFRSEIPERIMDTWQQALAGHPSIPHESAV